MNYNIENRRYTGSKAKLVEWIMALIHEECSGKTFSDIFAGTGVVAAAAATNSFEYVIINDLLYSNYASFKAFLGKGEWDKEKLNKLVTKYNNIDVKAIKENFFSINYSDKYFSLETAKKIGFMREEIGKDKAKLTEKEYFILLVSLMYSADKIANTVGHYDAYLQKKPKENEFYMKLIEPLNVKKVDIFREDANLLARKLKTDVAYIDPPYNSRQYSRFYHVLETLIKGDAPKLYGVALKPEPENMSDYCRVKAPEVFSDLIENLNCKYVVVSYNNTYDSKSNSSRNKIKLEQIKEILDQKGKTKIYKRSHRFFNTGKTEFDNHQEWLFITKAHE